MFMKQIRMMAKPDTSLIVDTCVSVHGNVGQCGRRFFFFQNRRPTLKHNTPPPPI